MADDSVIGTLESLNSDLSDLADCFTRLIKAARIQSGTADGGLPIVGSTGMEIFVESLVATSNEILNKIVALKRSQIHSNGDRTLYDNVRGAQYRLKAVTERSNSLFKNSQNGVVYELRSLLGSLQSHVGKSKFKVDTPDAEGLEKNSNGLDELCAEAMHAYLTSGN